MLAFVNKMNTCKFCSKMWCLIIPVNYAFNSLTNFPFKEWMLTFRGHPYFISFDITEHCIESSSFSHHKMCNTNNVFRVAELCGWCMCLYHATLSLRNDLHPEWMSCCGLYQDKKRTQKEQTHVVGGWRFLTASKHTVWDVASKICL